MKTKYNITEINPQTIREVRQMIKDSLSVIMEDNNLKFELGNATYDEDSFKFTGFRISLADALSPEQKALEKMLLLRKMTDAYKTLDATKIGTDRGLSYKLVGYKTRARVKPWIIQDIRTGSTYKAPDHLIDRMFGEVE